MNLAPFLRQQVAWQAVQTTNNRDDSTYAPAQNISCRKVLQSRDLIGKDGEVVTARTVVLMLTQPSIGDLLDGREVIEVDSCVDYRGTTVGYRARTQ